MPGIAHLSQGLSETQDLDALESEHRLVFWLHWVFEMECKLFVATLRGFSPVVTHRLLLLWPRGSRALGFRNRGKWA